MATWVEAAAARFWRDAGEEEPFPRGLEGSVSLALPVSVERLPRLRLSSAGRWLDERTGRLAWQDVSWRSLADRPLRGCLFAVVGHGCIFVDAEDPADEQRFTIAHEVAHFILDYLGPRERAERRLGAAFLEILDGERAPSRTERVDAALAGVDVRPYAHLFERGPLGEYGGRVAESEERADLLALELLAPEERALAALSGRGPFRLRVASGAETLRRSFGLPQSVAEWYARRLLRLRDGGEGWGSWLGCEG